MSCCTTNADKSTYIEVGFVVDAGLARVVRQAGRQRSQAQDRVVRDLVVFERHAVVFIDRLPTYHCQQYNDML